MTCDKCPLRGQPAVRGQAWRDVPTNGRYELAVVDAFPGFLETHQLRPIAGRKRKMLDRALEQTGLEHVWLTNAVACQPPQAAHPHLGMVNQCRFRLWHELKATGTESALACGIAAVEALLPGAARLSLDIDGLGQYHDELECNLTCTVRPEIALSSTDSFVGFAASLEKACNATEPYKFEIDPEYVVLDTPAKAIHWLRHAAFDDVVALDVETSGLDPRDDELLWIGVGSYDLVAIVPKDVAYHQGLAKVLEDFLRAHKTAGHNARFDSKFLKCQLGIEWNPDLDTMLLHHLVDERRGTHGLKQLATRYLNIPDYGASVEALISSGRAAEVPDEQMQLYLSYDVASTAKLAADHFNVTPAYRDLIRPGDEAIRRVESRGMRVDIDYLTEKSVEYDRREAELEARLVEIAQSVGLPGVNPRSTQQVAWIIYEELEREPVHTGDYSTAENVLERLEPHEFIDLVLKHRTVTKTNGTYLKGLLERADDEQIVRPHLLLHGTVTGRLSCRDPNIQAIPHAAGLTVRRAFVPRPGYVLVDADYSQLELRVAAVLSGDEAMLDIYRRGRDIHGETAAALFDKPAEEITVAERREAKDIVFACAYLTSARGLAEDKLDSTVEEAQQRLDTFWSTYSGLARWRDEVIEKARHKGQVTTQFGRTRHLPLVTATLQGSVARQAYNFKMQSTAADITLDALIRVDRVLEDLPAYIIMTIHDSIVFEVHEDVVDDVVPLIVQTMEDVCIESPIAFPVDVKVGPNWADTEEWTPNDAED